ncbi:MAG: hypothetical protein ACRCZI_09130 [Cetobacterium sp.]
MGVQAKFHITTIEIHAATGGSTVSLSPVARGDRNATWAAATPSGSLKIHATETETESFWGVLRSAREATAALLRKLDEKWDGIDHDYRTALEASRRWSAERAACSRYPEVLVLFEAAYPGVPDSRSLLQGSFNELTVTRSGNGTAGEVKLRRTTGGGWVEMTMQIQNPPAFQFYVDIHRGAAAVDVPFRIVPSLDGYPSDGHEFVQSVYPAGTYYHDKCAECGFPKTDHA